jgi:hypothetical protein
MAENDRPFVLEVASLVRTEREATTKWRSCKCGENRVEITHGDETRPEAALEVSSARQHAYRGAPFAHSFV